MRASFYECDVTPPLGGFLWGHYHEAYAKEVHTRIYAKALVVEDNGELAALITIDSCTLPVEMHDIVTKRIYEYTGISADKVCISANHTHYGAPIFDSPEIGCYADRTYTDVFFRLCADAVILAYRRLDEVDVKFSKSELEGICVNRNYVLDNGEYVTQHKKRPNIVRPLGEIDEEIPAVMFERNGKPVGAIISYALHQCTTREKIIGYSGDYSAILSLKLKEKYGNDFVSLFLVGACGDVNHLDRHKTEPPDYKTVGALLAEKVVDSMKNAAPVSGTVKSVKEFINVKRRSADPELARERMIELAKNDKNFMRLRNMMYYVSKAEPEYTSLAVQCIKIGDVLIACLPGEIYTAFAKRIKQDSPFEKTIVIENCNTYCGYIPTKEAFDEAHNNLYETSLCYHSCHVPEAGDIITDKALEIARNLK